MTMIEKIHEIDIEFGPVEDPDENNEVTLRKIFTMITHMAIAIDRIQTAIDNTPAD